MEVGDEGLVVKKDLVFLGFGLVASPRAQWERNLRVWTLPLSQKPPAQSKLSYPFGQEVLFRWGWLLETLGNETGRHNHKTKGSYRW